MRAARGDKDFKSATRDVAKLLGELKDAERRGRDRRPAQQRRRLAGRSQLDLTGLFIDKGPVVQVRNARGQVEAQGDDESGHGLERPAGGAGQSRHPRRRRRFSPPRSRTISRGLIIGEPTFGKGTVQNLVDLDRFAPSDNEKPRATAS